MRLWVRGDGKADFKKITARFTNARGETMQFPLSAETLAALNGSGWRGGRDSDFDGAVNQLAFVSIWPREYSRG